MARLIIDSEIITNADVFQELLDHFPDIIQSVDTDGRILYVNQTAEKLLGYTRAELLSMNIRQLYAPGILENVEEGFSFLKKKGEYEVFESVVLTKSGDPIDVEIRSFAIYDDSGQFVRTFSLLRDIREKRALRRSLIHSSKLAALGEMAGCVVHDMMNPLASIRLFCEMILQHLEQGEPIEESGDIVSIDRSAARLQTIVQQFRNLACQTDPVLEPTDLADVINDALFLMSKRVKGVQVDIGFGREEFLVMAAPTELEHVFMNLFSNACDAMEDCEIRTLTVTAERVLSEMGPRITCRVADSGPGIPEDIRGDIFKSFFTTREKKGGTGLGLAIARTIVLQHRGSLALAPPDSGGSAFIVTLPAAEGKT